MTTFSTLLEQAKQARLRDFLTEIVARDADQPEEILLENVRRRLSSNPPPLPEVIDRAALLADKHERYAIVTELLPRVSPETRETLFYSAAARGDDVMVEALLPKTGEPDFPSCKLLAMQNAATAGRLSTVKILHQHQFPLSAEHGGAAYGAVYDAAANEHRSVVEYLLENGANPMSAVLGAAGKGNKEIAQLGLDYGAKVETLDNPKVELTAILAAHAGQLEFLRWMHEEKNMPLSPNAIVEAAGHGQLEIVQWMVGKEGIDPNVNKGEALRRALEQGRSQEAAGRSQVAAYLKPLRAKAKPEDMDPWLDKTGSRAPKGLENEYPYDYDTAQFKELSRHIYTRLPVEEETTNAAAFRLLALFGSMEKVAEYVAAWKDSLGKARLDLMQAASFKLPAAEGWDQKAWAASALVHGPAMAELVEHALLLPLGPKETVEETKCEIERLRAASSAAGLLSAEEMARAMRGNQTRVPGVVPGLGGGGPPGDVKQKQCHLVC